MAATTANTDNDSATEKRFSSNFFARVTKTFPTVGIISDKAAFIYNNVKESNRLLKNGLETAENKINTYHHLLEKVDDFGVRQLQKVEDIAQSKPINAIKNSAVLSQAKSILSNKIITPTRSVLSNQLDHAITLSEQTVDKYVEKEVVEDNNNNNNAPIPSKAIRAQQLTIRVSKHLKNKALNAIKNSSLKIRTEQQIEQFKVHSVDLIKYYRDNIVEKRNVLVGKAKESAANQVTKARERASQVIKAVEHKYSEAKAATQEKIDNTKKRVRDRASLAYENITENHYFASFTRTMFPYASLAYSYIPNFRYRSDIEGYIQTSLISAQLYLNCNHSTTTEEQLETPRSEQEVPVKEIPKHEEPVIEQPTHVNHTANEIHGDNYDELERIVNAAIGNREEEEEGEAEKEEEQEEEQEEEEEEEEEEF